MQGSVEEHRSGQSARLTSPEAGSLRRMDLDTPRPVPMLWGTITGCYTLLMQQKGVYAQLKADSQTRCVRAKLPPRQAMGEHPASPPFPVNSCGWLSVAASFPPYHVFWVQIFPSLKDTVTMD